jgi:UDP-glucose-4-epimerase GalE
MYYRTNVGGTLTLLDACRGMGVERFVFSSTCATYGVPQRVPIDEDTPQAPINPYGRTKLMTELMLRDHASAFGLSVVALRYFNAAGADPDGELGEDHAPETHLIPLVLQVAAGLRDGIDVFGDDYDTPDGTCIRDYIHVSDLAAAHVAALSVCADGQFQAFNLGTGAGFSVREVIEAARRVTSHDIPIRIAPRRPGDPPALVANASRVAGSLGWRPRYSELDTMIRTAWGWMHASHLIQES